MRAAPESWCAERFAHYAPDPALTAAFQTISQRAAATDALGPQPLWTGYAALKDYPSPTQQNATRRASQVCTTAQKGKFFSWLAAEKKPNHILEFGSAFGVSGMYWLAGLEACNHGQLLTFEANTAWAAIARENLSAISPRFVLTNAVFEEEVPRLRAQGVKADLAFIDAIHTSAFVNQQLALVLTLAAPGAVILIDDINFSEDMAQCWHAIAQDPRFVAAYTLGGQIGIVECAR